MVGTGITLIRKKRNLSQIDLANKANMSNVYLSKIENNVNQPSLIVLQKLADALKTNVAVFFWMGLTREEISEEKKKAFDILKPSIDETINEIFFT